MRVIKKHDEHEWYCVLTREEFNSSDIKWKVRLGKDIVSGVNFIASHRSHRLRKKHNFIIIVFSTRKSLLPAKDLEIMNELPCLHIVVKTMTWQRYYKSKTSNPLASFVSTVSFLYLCPNTGFVPVKPR